MNDLYFDGIHANKFQSFGSENCTRFFNVICPVQLMSIDSFLCNNYLEEKKPLLYGEEEALKFRNKYSLD
jgi:hypothetical protein